ncbi:hypothetical protein VTN77DRAFT_5590 [Rasamsonia byssochlamydoides]|uniref:uncharacterized protein n=1 Tax=Rasamsonia byssochlamydoides TaxID=89139 RepID=UPI003742043A
MRVSSSLLFSFNIVALPTVTALYPFNIARDTPSPPSPADIVRQLGPKLSPNATIFTQGDSRFANATACLQEYDHPGFIVVVEPGTEQDVQTIVKYANSYDLPFLAVNRAHGSTKRLCWGYGPWAGWWLQPLRGFLRPVHRRVAFDECGVGQWKCHHGLCRLVSRSLVGDARSRPQVRHCD